MLFTIDTSSLQEGAYIVDIAVEQAESEQEVFDLGTIAVWQEFAEQETTEQETTEQETTEPEINASSNMLYLLLVFPAVAAVAFLVWRSRRNNKIDDEMAGELLPKLLKETLDLEGKGKAEAGENKNSAYDKSYIR